jgi:hypothetical protein
MNLHQVEDRDHKDAGVMENSFADQSSISFCFRSCNQEGEGGINLGTSEFAGKLKDYSFDEKENDIFNQS